MPTPSEQELMMQMIDRHEQPSGPVSGVEMADPNTALAQTLSRQFNIPVDQILAIPPVEGMTLRQQLDRMRPSANIGGLELGVDGSVKEPRITGRVEF